jgi:hypothetical protein
MPALSPDLDSLDLYLRGHHIRNVDLPAAVFNDLTELRQRAKCGFDLIRNTAGIFDYVQQSLRRAAAVREHNTALSAPLFLLHVVQTVLCHFFIVVPCILITSKFLFTNKYTFY